MVIHHNLTAMNADRQLNIVTGTQAKHMEKLSSGYRINRAADDAAGLAISEKMRRLIRGLNKGIENAQDGVSLCQIADSALNEVSDMLHRLEELSVKAANGTNTEADRQMIQEEVDQILSEINRVSDTSTFNEQKIFEGGTVPATGAASGTGTAQAQTYNAAQLYNMTMFSAEENSAIQTFSASQEAAEINALQTYAAAAENSIVCGDFTISGTSGAVLTEGTDYKFENSVLTILSDKEITIRNTDSTKATTNRIEVASGVNANITLAGVNIDVSNTGNNTGNLSTSTAGDAAFKIADESKGNVTITLADGTNNILKSGCMCAGLQKKGGTSTGTLTITGNTGVLTATGGACGAGIGGNYKGNANNITISGGNVTATGGVNGAGIGSGYGEGASIITISGGNVTATGGQYGAGIGAGAYGGTEYITISGGNVTAMGGQYAAGIGSSTGTYAGYITISGGSVTATGGEYGAGIGGGQRVYARNITISDACVAAKGGSGAKNHIGSGANGGGSINITKRNSLVIEGDTGTVTGNARVRDDFTVGSDVTVEIGEDASLTVEKGATLTNNGTIDVHGELVNNGDIVNNGRINFYGKLKNNGRFTNGGTVNNTSGADIANDGTFSNNGTVNNDGTFSNRGTLNNDGNVTNDGTLTNANGADIDNNGAFSNNGTFTNANGADMDNDGTFSNSGTLNNDGNITNDGTVKNDRDITNSGSINNTANGTLTNEGNIDNSKGTITDNGTINGSGNITGNAPINGSGGDPNDPGDGGDVDPDDPNDGGSGGSQSGPTSGILKSLKRWWIQCGSESGVGMFVEIESIDTVTLGIHGMDVTTQESADKAISMIAGALEKVSSVRSNIGAQQNRLEHTINNEMNIVENTTAAESRIRDTDIAGEMLGLTTANILAQAGISVLVQANTSNEEVLMLLR